MSVPCVTSVTVPIVVLVSGRCKLKENNKLHAAIMKLGWKTELLNKLRGWGKISCSRCKAPAVLVLRFNFKSLCNKSHKNIDNLIQRESMIWQVWIAEKLYDRVGQSYSWKLDCHQASDEYWPTQLLVLPCSGWYSQLHDSALTGKSCIFTQSSLPLLGVSRGKEIFKRVQEAVTGNFVRKPTFSI